MTARAERAPLPGDPLYIAGRTDHPIVADVELTASSPDRPTVWLVRSLGGSRWSVRGRDGSADGLWFEATALPADPNAAGF